MLTILLENISCSTGFIFEKQILRNQEPIRKNSMGPFFKLFEIKNQQINNWINRWNYYIIHVALFVIFIKQW